MKKRQPSQIQNVIDRLRFLSRSYGGKGDYTAEREQLFKGESIESIIAEIKTIRPKNEGK